MSQEPRPRDPSLTRAQRRRLKHGRPEEAVAGLIGCKFCKSTQGTYEKARGNHFVCQTPGCKANAVRGTDKKVKLIVEGEENVK